MSYLLANGCSFTNKNYNTDSHGWVHSIEEKKRLGIPLEDWKMWPEYVADKLEFLHKNIASSGNSNEKICNYSITEAHLLKPKVMMILWSSGWRKYFLGTNLHHGDYVKAIQIANQLLKQSEEISWNNNMCKDVRLAFGLLNHYHPESYDRCKEFYSKKSSEIKNMHTLEDVMKARYKMNRLPVILFTKYFLQLYREGSSINQQMNFISEELKPLLHLYEYCKSEKIQLVTKCLLPFGGWPTHKMFKVRSEKSPTIFDKMLKGVETIVHNTDKVWTDNYYFKKLDDLVADKKYIIENWPCHRALQNKYSPRDFLRGWKKVSDRDSHPHWDTQKLIGDVFYDLYKKNYA